MIQKEVLGERDAYPVISGSTISSPSSATWFFLSFEFFLGLGISGFLDFLGIVKSFLPKPPRNLSGDVVLVTGATTSLGRLLSEEFARGGCSVICVDRDGGAVEAAAARLRANYPGVESAGPRHRKQQDDEVATRRGDGSLAYSCDLWDREEIKRLARRVREDVGRVDVLVTCTGSSGQGVFDAVSRTLMSHYWTVLAFLPSMLHRETAHIVGVTPTISTDDAYMGSKAAIAGLMESFGQQFAGRNNRLRFMTVAPKADPSLIKQSEREIAKEVVQAIQRDQSCLTMSWSSKRIYEFSCRLYESITRITRWLDT